MQPTTTLPILLLALALLTTRTHNATAYPTPIQPDPTYQTGQSTIINTGLTASSTYTINYNWAMATASLNATLGVVGMSFNFNDSSHGWQQSLISLNKSALIMQVTVVNKYDPINYMKISYLVSYSQLLDMGYVTFYFGSTHQVRNHTIGITPSPCSYLACRYYNTSSIPYNAKNGAKIQTYLAGFSTANITQQAVYTYAGLTLQPWAASSSVSKSFYINVTVYGGIEISFISFFFLAFEPSVANVANYRTAMTSRNSYGCYYHPWTCGVSNPLSNSLSYSGQVDLKLKSPYTTQMFFMGVDRFIAEWDGTANNFVAFDITSSGAAGTSSAVYMFFAFTGNPLQKFTLTYSCFTMQTYCCPNTAPNIYYTYGSNNCTDTCNSWIGQYANASRFCHPCGIFCYMCSLLTDNCTACYNTQNRVLLNNTCLCDTNGGFYDDGTSINCSKCDYTCASCSGPGGGACLTCSSSSYRTFNSNSCVCNLGYYDSGASTCSACYYTCKSATCTSSAAIGCATCDLTKNRVILGNYTCGCMDGYYEFGVNNEMCAPCLYSCVKCWGANTYCTQCDPLVMLRTQVANTCVCGIGYYDAGIPICQQCYITCQTCNGPSSGNCQTCPPGLRHLNGSTCVCNDGYYDLMDLCTLCHYSCATCSAATNFNCTSCTAGSFRTYDATIKACTCNAGYVENGAPVCAQCASSCLTCLNSASYCTSCHNTTARYLQSGSCLCSAGYVDTYSNGTCSLCHYSCKTCSGIASNNCIMCAPNRTLSSGSCVCGTSYFDNGSVSCQLCVSTCLTCNNGLASSCTSCNAAYSRTLSASPAGSCICSDGYYDTGSLICARCNIKCLTCNSNSSCVSCDSLINHRSLNPSNMCVCDAGYFQMGSAACQACSSSCVTCISSATYCTSCASDRYLSSNNLCVCNSGTFLNVSSQCQSCYYTCLTCTNINSNSCLSCYSNSNRNLSNGYCSCVAGYYDNLTVVCAACPYTCRTCTNSTNCITCPLNSNRVLQPNSSCTCPSGYYDGFQPTCQLCSYQCATCTAFAQCQSCNSSALRTWDPATLVCPCNNNYYDDGLHATCQPCHYSCLTCTGGSSSSCVSCQSNRTLNASGYCVCQVGLYEYLSSCNPCSLKCLGCYGAATNCTSCYVGSYLSNNQCLCSPGYYLNGQICSSCDTSCQTCTSSASQCTSCNSTRGTVLSGSSCVCPTHTFQLALICINCHWSCLNCSSSSNNSCLNCNTSLLRTYNSTSSSCPCNPGYYDSGSAQCEICSLPCLTCNGASILNCTSCVGGYRLIGSSCIKITLCNNYYYMGYCVDRCPNTTYPLANTCATCINYCQTCLSDVLCSSCIASFYLFNGSCKGSCPVGTYAWNGSCSACPRNCESCVYRQGIVCVSCVANFYLSADLSCNGACAGDQSHVIIEGRCVECIWPCARCWNLTSTGCLSCKSGYILFNGSCLSACPNGYLLQNLGCKNCPSICSSCIQGQCKSCIAGYYLSPNGNCIPIGYYIDNDGTSRACHPNCKTCTNTSFSSCIACNHYRGDNSQMALSGYCSCWKGSVDLGDGRCEIETLVGLQKASQTLISGMSAANCISMIGGVVSMNFMGAAFTYNYQQTYGTFYYLNSSMVGQRDSILQFSNEISPNTYFNSLLPSSILGRRLEQKNMQQLQSLFMRGSKNKYLIEWALFSVIFISVVWVGSTILNCGLRRFNDSTKSKSKLYVVGLKIYNFMREPFLIIIHFITVGQITFYAMASFRILLDSHQVDIIKTVLSLLVAVYYLAYTVRLLVGCIREDITKKNSDISILYACFQPHNLKIPLKRLYLPFMMVRSIMISVFVVAFSNNALYQVGCSLAMSLIFTIYSLCYCPYGLYIKLFLRSFELLFTIQLILLMVSVSKPEGDRLVVSIVLLVCDYLQLAASLGMAIAIVINHLHGFRCCNVPNNATAPLKSQSIVDSKGKSKSLIEETLQGFEEAEYKVANCFQDEFQKGKMEKQPKIQVEKIQNARNGQCGDGKDKQQVLPSYFQELKRRRYEHRGAVLFSKD